MNLRGNYVQYTYSWVFYGAIVALPLLFYKYILAGCPVPYGINSPLPPCNTNNGTDGVFFFMIIGVPFILAITKHLNKPWDPFFIITDKHIQYRKIALFFHFHFLDKYIWQTYELSSIAKIQLVIREQDKEKEGFRAGQYLQDQKGYKEYYKNLSFDDFIKIGLVHRTWNDIKPIFKNQKLQLFGQDGNLIDELSVSFAYEEDLNNLNDFLIQKHIPFTITFADIPDELQK